VEEWLGMVIPKPTSVFFGSLRESVVHDGTVASRETNDYVTWRFDSVTPV
jgi:hypothetical protein